MYSHELYENLGDLFFQLLHTCADLEEKIGRDAVGADDNQPKDEFMLAELYGTTAENILKIDYVTYKKIQGRLYFRIRELREAGNMMAWDMPLESETEVLDAVEKLVLGIPKEIVMDCFSTVFLLLTKEERIVCQYFYDIHGVGKLTKAELSEQLDMDEETVWRASAKLIVETVGLAKEVLDLN